MSIVLKYDKDLDCVVIVSRKGHHYENYQRNQRANSRSELWLPMDFKNRSVLDIGCSYGGTMAAAKRMGAKTVTGFDACEDAVDSCIAAGYSVRLMDINDPRTFRRCALADTVMCLAVWHTSPFSERKSIMAHAAQLANDCMYWETHRNESPVEVAYYIFHYTRFTNIRKLGEYTDENRCLLRASYDGPSSSATMLKDPYPEFSDFEELQLCL